MNTYDDWYADNWAREYMRAPEPSPEESYINSPDKPSLPIQQQEYVGHIIDRETRSLVLFLYSGNPDLFLHKEPLQGTLLSEKELTRYIWCLQEALTLLRMLPSES